VLKQIVLVYRTLSECQVVACSTCSAQRKNTPTESVSVGMQHDQVAVVSGAKCGQCASALTEMHISCKYIGADPFTQLQTSIQILNVMRWRTGNQCSVSCMAVVIHLNLALENVQ